MAAKALNHWFGALGGMASRGILGMFLGATVLALGYEIFKGWVAANPDGDAVISRNEPIQQGEPGAAAQNVA